MRKTFLVLPLIVGVLMAGCSKNNSNLVSKLASSNNSNSNNDLIPVRVGDKWGYINPKGKIVINPQFTEAKYFSEGLAAAYISSNSCGYINDKGKFVINPQFQKCKHFSEGLAPVKQNGKWGYINPKGKMVINPQFDEADYFSEGLADVGLGNHCGYIDKKGKYVVNPQFDDCDTFSENLAPVQSGDHYGYINKKGQFVINPQFRSVDSFHNGVAVVQADNKKWGVINNKGQYIINPIYDNGYSSFNHGKDLFININKDRKSYTIYIVDKTGKVLKTFNYDISKDKIFKLPVINIMYHSYIPTIYADITQNNQSYKVGYMDENGNMIIKPQFKLAEDFLVDGMAPVLVGKVWGLIDKTGKIVVNPQFNDIMLKYNFRNMWEEGSANYIGNAYTYYFKAMNFIKTAASALQASNNQNNNNPNNVPTPNIPQAQNSTSSSQNNTTNASDPVSVVKEFYADIPNDLVDAYSLLSPQRRANMPFSSWASGYQTTIGDILENVQLVNSTPNTADVKIYLKSEDNANGGILVQHWQGVWHLVNINGQWYLDRPNIIRVDRYIKQ